MDFDMRYSHGIGGGQGRRPSELREEAFWTWVVVVSMAALLIVAIAGAISGN